MLAFLHYNRFFAYIFLALVLGLSLSADAQVKVPVRWEDSFSPEQDLQPGDVITLAMQAKIDPGYHVYSATPPPDWPNLATIFELDPASTGVEISGGLREDGNKESGYDEVFETDISLFHDKVTFLQDVKITAENPTINGLVRYMVCNDEGCIPDVHEVAFSVKTATPKPAEKASPKSETPTAKAENNPPIPLSPNVLPVNATSEPAGILNSVAWTWERKPEGNVQNGDRLTLILTAEIDPGYHIYSSVPPKKPAGMPTSFELDESSQQVELAGPIREEGELQTEYDQVFETEVSYFEGKVTFEQDIQITGENPVLAGYMAYQVCDDKTCVPGTFEVTVDLGISPTVVKTATVSPKVEQGPPEEESLLALFFKSFLAGLVALFTPCVFPMIPLTVSVFTKQAGDRSRGIRNGIFYGVSIVFIYTFLGLLLSVVFGPQVLQTIANDPWANLIFAALLIVFGLSFLGMFELTLPASWSTAIGKQSGRGGLMGIFLMALTLAIVSFSCTAPIVGTALFQAVDTGSFGSPAVSMLGFSSAIAIPFALFAIFPSWLQSLPKSGGWLNTVKVTLGFLEIAFALTYLSQANMSAWHFEFLNRTVLLSAHIVIFALLGLYLLGKLRLPHDSPIEKISVPRLLLSMSSFVVALALLPGLWGAPLKLATGLLVLPNENAEEMGVLLLRNQAVTGLSSGENESQGEDICSFPNKKHAHLNDDTPLGFCAFYDLEQGLAYAREVNKPVFLDFTGHTCKNCRHVEKNVWPDPEVKRLLNQEYVLVSLYTDDRARLKEVEYSADGQKKLRTIGDKYLQYQIDTYRTNAQPFYVLLDHNNQPLIEPIGYTTDIPAYRAYLKEGLEAFRQQLQ